MAGSEIFDDLIREILKTSQHARIPGYFDKNEAQLALELERLLFEHGLIESYEPHEVKSLNPGLSATQGLPTSHGTPQDKRKNQYRIKTKRK
jgi:hypothetical protein